MAGAARDDDPREPAEVEVDEVEQRWSEFERALGALLTTMGDPDDGDLLVLEVPGFDDDAPGTAPFVQFATAGVGELLRTEMAGNAHLDQTFALSAHACARMRESGWSGADADEKNWVREDPMPLAREVASQVVRVLREEFGVAHPDLLTYRAWGPTSDAATQLGLCSSTEVPTDTVDRRFVPDEAGEDGGPPTGLVHEPETRDDLLLMVGSVLREKLGEVMVDDDGDFVLRHMNQPVFVRALPDQPAVQIFTRVVHAVKSRESAAVEIGLLNRDDVWMKWTLRDRSIWQTVTVPAMPFAEVHLAVMVDLFRQTMERTRDDLALRTGGEVA